MSGIFVFAVGLVVLVLAIVRMIAYYKAEIKTKQDAYDKLLSQKKSSEVRLGQISEQLAPMLEGFKYDPKQTHFLGMPVDFIIFQPDKVVFLEIKSGKAQLNSRQKEIKQLILDKKVTWDEMRIDGKQPEIFYAAKLRETSGNSSLTETHTDATHPVTFTAAEDIIEGPHGPAEPGIKRQRMD